MFKIINENFEAEIAEYGAEVHVLKRKNENYNYVWCGNLEKGWASRNPICFPQCEANYDKSILVDGKKYFTKVNHGFARTQTFKLIEQKDNELTLGITDTEDTLNQYPFKFELKVNYKLIDNRLEITYTIKNNSDRIMPFGFGCHPAFTCTENKKDTKIIFDKMEKCGNELLICDRLFEMYPTYEIHNPKSSKATLITGDRQVTVEYDGFRIICVWTRGDFVCIEPWMNICPLDDKVELKDRPDSLFLDPNESTNIKYAWVIDK